MFYPEIGWWWGRGCVHTCQLRGRVWLNIHTFTHHTHKPRTKHLCSLCWYLTNGLTDKSTDLSCIFLLPHVFVLRVPTHLVTLKAHVTFGCPTDSSVKWWYTGVPLFPEFLKGFFHLTHGDGCCSFIALRRVGVISWLLSMRQKGADVKPSCSACVEHLKTAVFFCVLPCHVFRHK